MCVCAVNENTNKLAHNTWISTQSTGETTFRFPFRSVFMTIRVLAATIALSLLLRTFPTSILAAHRLHKLFLYHYFPHDGWQHRTLQHTRRIFVSTVKMEFMLWWSMRPEKRTLSSILILFALLNIGLGGESTVNNNKRKHNLAIRKTFRTQCCNLVAASFYFSLSSGRERSRNVFGTKVQREEGKKNIWRIFPRAINLRMNHQPHCRCHRYYEQERKNGTERIAKSETNAKKSNYFQWR